IVSGFVTSPLDHERICFEEARPMLIASKLLMSIIRCSSWKGWSVAGTAPGSRLPFRFHVFGLLLFRALVGLAALALRLDLLLGLVVRVRRRLADAGQVDAQLLGRPQQVVVL